MLSELAAEVVRTPKHRGPLDDATHYGVSGSPGDGPYVQIWLRISDGIIQEAAFKTPGCPSSTACGGVVCALVSGRGVERAFLLTVSDLMAVLGGLPEGKEHYAVKAIEALDQALRGEI